MKIDKRISKSFVFQKDKSDCGVACLSSIINFHGGIANFEKIRIVSGTSKQGTTLLGLCQAAGVFGFEAEGLQTDISYLEALSNPAILHVVTHDRMLHYMVYYQTHNGMYLIGDPALGVKWMTSEELKGIWVSGKLLSLNPIAGRFILEERDRQNKWKWFLPLLRADISILFTILIIGIVMSVLGLATAVFSQVFIDNLIPSGDRLRIFIAITLIGFLMIARTVIGYFRQHLSIKQGVDINIRITKSFLTNLFLLPLPFFATRKIGDMVARLNDIGRIQQVVSYLFGELLISVLVVLVSFSAIFLYSVWIGIILLASIPFFGWVAYKYQKPVVTQQKELMNSYALNESNYISTISNIQPIKSFKREKLFTCVAVSVFSNFQEKVYNLGMLGATMQLFTGLIVLSVTIGIIALSALQMLGGNMSTGVFMAVFSLSMTVLPALANIAFTNIQIQGAKVAFERMYEFSGMDKEFDDEEERNKLQVNNFTSLTFQEVAFRYPGRSLIIDQFSFNVKRGEIVSIFGDNGTGKSTLFSLIQRFYKPDSGFIFINDQLIDEISLLSYRNLLGVVPQNITLINAPLITNITLSNSEQDAQNALGILEKLGFHPYFERFPQGYLTMLGDGGVQISGGQKQLVGFARALVCNPHLLLLDELTVHMDRCTENFVLALLAKLKNSMGILSITHSIRNAALADRIIVLCNGRIEAIGTHVQLLQSNNQYSVAHQLYANI